MARSSWREGNLFEPRPERRDEESGLPPGTVRVVDLAIRMQNALKEAFPRRVWVVGEISEIERSLHKKHWFFSLCGTDPRDGRAYTLGAVLWSFDHQRLFGRGGTLYRVIDPKDGIEVRALVEVDFYAPGGAIRLVVREIDPTFTLGKIAIERRKLIEKLTGEGILQRQQRLPLHDVPLRVGLITSGESAAYNDFVEELRRSGIAFRIFFKDARMQGEATVQTVVRAIDDLRRGVDVLAIVRGGGSVTDLAWFDKEEIARAIANSPVPVLTGIGHEIDTAVADMVAWRTFKTPTAVASFLGELGAIALRSLTDATRRLRDVARRPAAELSALRHQAGALRHAIGAAMSREREIHARARNVLARASDSPRRERTSVRDASLRLARVAQRSVAMERRDLVRSPERLHLSVRGDLARASERLLRHRADLTRSASRSCRRETERLSLARTRLALLDPATVLKRGYVIVRDVNGEIVKHAAATHLDQRLSLQFQDTERTVRVVDTTPQENETAPRAKKNPHHDEQEEERRHRQLEIWGSEGTTGGDPGAP